MIQDHAVGIFARDGFFQFLDRFREAAQAVQRPAEAVAVRHVVRLAGHRSARHLVGPIQILALVGPEVSQIVQGAGVLGEFVQDLLQPLFGLS